MYIVSQYQFKFGPTKPENPMLKSSNFRAFPRFSSVLLTFAACLLCVCGTQAVNWIQIELWRGLPSWTNRPDQIDSKVLWGCDRITFLLTLFSCPPKRSGHLTKYKWNELLGSWIDSFLDFLLDITCFANRAFLHTLFFFFFPSELWTFLWFTVDQTTAANQRG